jgi:hypothetical protein
MFKNRLVNSQLKTGQTIRVNNSVTWKPQPTRAAVEADASPFLLEFFMVQGFGFRCMAYRDDDGRWRSAFDNQELAGHVWISE